MNIDVVDISNNATDEFELDASVFEDKVREPLFWEVVNWQRARRRAGTQSTKGRSEVRGGGKKPWRQKGTGRARAGTIRSPLWVGGGTTHGPKPRDFSYSMPKKKRKVALRSALSMKARDGQLKVVDSLEFSEIKTKLAVKMLDALGAKSALLVDVTNRDPDTNEISHNETLRLSVRNLPNAKYVAAEGLNVEDILRYEYLVMSRAAVEQVQEALKS